LLKPYITQVKRQSNTDYCRTSKKQEINGIWKERGRKKDFSRNSEKVLEDVRDY